MFVKELTTESGVSREMIGKYERGGAMPSIEAAKKLARALGVTLDYLGGEADGPAFDRETAERLKDIGTLDEGDREHVFITVLHKKHPNSCVQLLGCYSKAAFNLIVRYKRFQT